MSDQPAKRRPYFRVILVVAVGLLTLILVLQNTETVETRLLFTTVAMPRAALLLTTFLFGLVMGLVLAFIRKRRPA